VTGRVLVLALAVVALDPPAARAERGHPIGPHPRAPHVAREPFHHQHRVRPRPAPRPHVRGGWHPFVYYYPYPRYYPYWVPYPVWAYPPPPYEPGWGTAPDDEPPPPEASAPPPGEEARRASYGLVQLRGVPDGAAVELNGRFWLTAEALDERWLALPDGEHTLAIRVGEAEPVVRRIDVRAGKMRIERFGPFPAG
jgi:hypothetical protein